MQDPPVGDAYDTVLDAYCKGLDSTMTRAQHVAQLLRFGLFQYEQLAQPAARLSVGQRRKLEIARLLALRPTTLLLDEPTNHLALDVLESFESAVLEFPGPVIAVSHDRWFLDRFRGRRLELTNGSLQPVSPVPMGVTHGPQETGALQ